MAEPNPPTTLETPEEVLEAEIEALERRTLDSGWLWVSAAIGLVILFSAAFLITNWDRHRANARTIAIVPEAMTLREPVGTVSRDLTFRWDRVEGAASYILVVTSRDHDEVELLRPVRESFLRPSETEVSNFNPGWYAWTVEARSGSGQLLGYGNASFAIPSAE